MGRRALPTSFVVVERIQLLEGFWTEDLSSLLVIGWRPLSLPFQVALSIRASTGEEPKREDQPGRNHSLLRSNHRSDTSSLLPYSTCYKQLIILPHLSEENYIRAWIPMAGDHQKPSQKLLSTMVIPMKSTYVTLCVQNEIASLFNYKPFFLGRIITKKKKKKKKKKN